MSTSMVILRQLIIMFLYMAVGFALFRAKLVTKEGSRALANLLIYAVLPSVLFKSFCVPRTSEKTKELLISMAAALVLLLVAMAISHLAFRKRPIDDIAVAFSNAGFIGLPLVTAAFGADHVFFAAGFVALLNVLQVTYGQAMMARDRLLVSPKNVVKIPIVIATVLGLIVFFSGISIPELPMTAITSLSALNGPLAMVIIGVYMAQTDFRSMFTDKNVYLTCLVRLVVIPAVTLAIVKLTMGNYPEIAKTLLVVACAPIGSNVAVYAQKLNLDYTYAVKIVCLSTVLSLLTLPIVMMFL